MSLGGVGIGDQGAKIKISSLGVIIAQDLISSAHRVKRGKIGVIYALDQK